MPNWLNIINYIFKNDHVLFNNIIINKYRITLLSSAAELLECREIGSKNIRNIFYDLSEFRHGT